MNPQIFHFKMSTRLKSFQKQKKQKKKKLRKRFLILGVRSLNLPFDISSKLIKLVSSIILFLPHSLHLSLSISLTGFFSFFFSRKLSAKEIKFSHLLKKIIFFFSFCKKNEKKQKKNFFFSVLLSRMSFERYPSESAKEESKFNDKSVR